MMIRKFVYGNPFETDSVVVPFDASDGEPPVGSVDLTDGFCFSCALQEEDIVYGLGEAVRGINKRGYVYVSNCTDEPHHTEDKVSLYGAHNFLLIAGEKNTGLFFDYPSAVRYDIGYTRTDLLTVRCARADLALYVIEGDSPSDISRQFRKIIGQSYIAPRFAFGYGQSRWGYRTPDDFREAAEGYRRNHIPLDMLYMDIDYMQDYEDFTVNEENFPDFPAFVQEMKDSHIRLIPIIDAAVKVQPGYSVYEEGVKNGYFCKNGDGTDFMPAVWPGYSHLPDVLNPEARRWFGLHYRDLTSQGIEGFWNDMNEPALFYTPRGAAEAKEAMQSYLDSEKEDAAYTREFLEPSADEPDGKASPKEDAPTLLSLTRLFFKMSSSADDYASFYHNIGGEKVRHDLVHNLYGYNMTRAAAEGLEEIDPDRRYLLFSRSSCIGMHRYGGIWTGDNCSWWEHILLNLKMLPSLNMCGFLYIGADLGGFNCDTSRDLLLRWLALGVFTPLMRNHSAMGTRPQECWRFEHPEDFRSVIGVRYRLLPYIYSEYMKAALGGDLMFKPLAFVWPEDRLARRVEDQLVLGNEIMIAPVYVQNAEGRYVYLPEEMIFVRFQPEGKIQQETLPAGHHYVEIALNEVPLFIRKGKCIPLAEEAEYADAVSTEHLELLGYGGTEYLLYDDDGIGKDYENPKNYRMLKKG